jgi:hypothetical protein
MQFLHWQHLKLHKKTIRDVREEFPNLPTMTKKDSEKRSKRRKKCETQIIETCNQLYGGIGYSSEELLGKSEKTTKRKFGKKNIMKTDHGKKFFLGELNPLKDPEISKKVSDALKGRPSLLKGKTYEEIMGKDKAKKRRKQQIINGQKGWLAAPRISTPQLQLYEMVKEKYPTAILEYPLGDFCIDVAVPEEKLAFEYDGSYWHDPEKDAIRDSILGKLGWKVFRFVDSLPLNIDPIPNSQNK